MMASLRAAAAARAMERTAKSSNERTTKAQGFERHYNARPAAPKGAQRHYNARPAAPQGFASGYNARPTAAQPEPPAGNSNTRSSAPGNFPPNRADAGTSAKRVSAVGRAGRTSAPKAAQSSVQPGMEPRPAYIGQDIGRGDGFTRATAKARARLRQSM